MSSRVETFVDYLLVQMCDVLRLAGAARWVRVVLMAPLDQESPGSSQ
jgi:hypothetical protein